MLFILELVWLVIGSVWVTNEYKDCDWIVVTTVRVLVGLAWVGVMVFFFMFGEFNVEDFLDPFIVINDHRDGFFTCFCNKKRQWEHWLELCPPVRGSITPRK